MIGLCFHPQGCGFGRHAAIRLGMDQLDSDFAGVLDKADLAREALLPVDAPLHSSTAPASGTYENACEALSTFIEEHLLDRKNYRMFPKHDSIPPTIVIYVIVPDEVKQTKVSAFLSSFSFLFFCPFFLFLLPPSKISSLSRAPSFNIALSRS
jgi:hypothetical protein